MTRFQIEPPYFSSSQRADCVSCAFGRSGRRVAEPGHWHYGPINTLLQLDVGGQASMLNRFSGFPARTNRSRLDY